MDRQQAAEALLILRRVVSQTKDDMALANWGIVWVLGAITNGAGFIVTHFLLRDGVLSPPPYLALWLPILIINAVAMLMKERRGARSFVESQVWSIWNTFILAMILMAILNYLMGLERLFMPAAAAVLVAFAFSMMGALMARIWFVPAVLWAGVAIVMALLSDAQFLVLGILWFITQGTNGVVLHLIRRKKLADGARPRLV